MMYCARYFAILLWIRIFHNAFCIERLIFSYGANINIVNNSTSRSRTSLTTDNDKSTDVSACFVSKNGTEGWWQAYLGYGKVIERIQITNVIGANITRSKTLLAGYAVYVTPDDRVPSDSDKQYLCYQDTDKYLPDLFQNQTCIGYGRYITIVNKRPPIAGQVPGKDYSKSIAFELCEVEIFGCSSNRYGEDCVHTCPSNCNNYRCFPSNGTCMNGCRPGYSGSKCRKTCNDGYYGDGCRSECGNCTGNTTCNHVNGACTGECLPGWKHSKCDKECSKGYYGAGCRKYCRTCSSQLCNKETGECQNGCVSGWNGSTCDTACSDGYYGDGCRSKCGKCAGNETCHHITGACTGECLPGWRNSKCDTECSKGYYGPGCRKYCRTCSSNLCNNETGECQNGCAAGWEGNRCDTACQSGMYGPGCGLKCGSCTHEETCNHVNGRCTYGCSDGYMGERCDTTGEVLNNVYVIVICISGNCALIFVVVFLHRLAQSKQNRNVESFELQNIENNYDQVTIPERGQSHIYDEARNK